MSASDSLIKRASEELEDFITTIVPDEVAALIGKRKIIDLNKEAAKYRLRLFGVSSSNIEPGFLEDVKNVLTAKYTVIVEKIINDLIYEAKVKGKNPVKAVTKGLSNSRFTLEKNALNVIDKALVAENVIFNIPSLTERAILEGNSRELLGRQSTVHTATHMQVSPARDEYLSAAVKAAERRAERNAASAIKKTAAKYITKFNTAHGTNFSDEDFSYLVKSDFGKKSLDPNANPALSTLTPAQLKDIKNAYNSLKDYQKESIDNDEELLKAKNRREENRYVEITRNFMFTTEVNIMRIESEKILDMVGHTRDRSILFNYIKLRAGKNKFWRDFVLNLDEIDRSVERNVSASQDDRILAAMMRKGGTLSPQLFSDISEAKYYIMALDKTDIDVLLDKYDFDIRKTSSLHTLFDKYNILSLVITDQIKKEVIVYSSDDPTVYDIVNVAPNSDQDRLMSMFSSLARN